jgi:hypothetical protein
MFNLLKTSGYFTYQQLNIKKLYVLLTQFIDVFFMDLRTNSDFCLIRH